MFTYLHIYMYLYMYTYVHTPPDPINHLCSFSGIQIFENHFTYHSVQIFKPCAEDQMLQDLILRTRLCGTAFILNMVERAWLNRVESFISRWPKWSGGNDLYLLGTSSQRADRRGWPLKIFTWFVGLVGTYTYTYIYVFECICICIYIYICICIYR